MSPKIIIWIPGKPLLHGHKRREFLWSVPHACYLYEGREIELGEFNAKYEKAMRNNADLNPRVKILGLGTAEAPAPVATIVAAHEVTADEAEEVLMRLRPERLKKKTGPKAAVMEVA